ncbi:uncharacterized protein DS421_14g460620 [Arachis hypogaea]|nr:uncharacterized protein DS421_14g460620 [Arachis hypogaea]
MSNSNLSSRSHTNRCLPYARFVGGRNRHNQHLDSGFLGGGGCRLLFQPFVQLVSFPASEANKALASSKIKTQTKSLAPSTVPPLPAVVVDASAASSFPLFKPRPSLVARHIVHAAVASLFEASSSSPLCRRRLAVVSSSSRSPSKSIVPLVMVFLIVFMRAALLYCGVALLLMGFVIKC